MLEIIVVLWAADAIAFLEIMVAMVAILALL